MPCWLKDPFENYAALFIEPAVGAEVTENENLVLQSFCGNEHSTTSPGYLAPGRKFRSPAAVRVCRAGKGGAATSRFCPVDAKGICRAALYS